jgi:hypothetical protein
LDRLKIIKQPIQTTPLTSLVHLPHMNTIQDRLHSDDVSIDREEDRIRAISLKLDKLELELEKKPENLSLRENLEREMNLRSRYVHALKIRNQILHNRNMDSREEIDRKFLNEKKKLATNF